MVRDDYSEDRFTRDRETIRRWAEEHDVMPVRDSETESIDDATYRFESEPEHADEVETLTWDEFFRLVEANDLIVIYYSEDVDRTVDVVDQEEAVDRLPLESGEIEERLMAGETVSSELTETTIVERTIVEHATVESEIVETEVLDSRVLDVDLLTRSFGGFDVVDRAVLDEIDTSRFEDVDRLESEGFTEKLPRSIAVEVEVEEEWLVTRELLELVTVESRIVDTDVTETDEVESESLESTIGIEAIQQAVLESDIIETEADAEEIVRSDAIESEVHGDDVVQTQLTHSRTVEEGITEEKVLRGELTEIDVIRASINESTPIETAFVDSEALNADATSVGVTEYEPETRGEAGVRIELTEDDVGKRVVNAHGQKIGMIEDVQAGIAYVDPEPGVVDRIKAALELGDHDDDAYPLEEGQIERITDEEVEISISK